MKKLLLILLCLPMIGFGQEWSCTYQATYPGTSTPDFTYGRSILQKANGHYIWLINSSYNETRIEVREQTGILLSTHSISGFGGCFRLQQTNDGGYIMISGVSVVKLDSLFNTEWASTPIPINVIQSGSPLVHDVRQTSDNGYILTGSLPWADPNGYIYTANMYIRKLDSNGNEVWLNTFLDSTSTTGVSILETNTGGYVLIADSHYQYQLPANIIHYALFIKTDVNGVVQSRKVLQDGNNDFDAPGHIIKTSDGNYIILGNKEDPADPNNDKEVWIKKMDLNGMHIWQKFYGYGFPDYGTSIKETSDGGYIISAAGDLPFMMMNIFLACCQRKIWALKTDSQGDTLWTQSWVNNEGQDDQDYGYDVIETNDGGFAITGTILDTNWQNSAILIKFFPPLATTIETPILHPLSKKIKKIMDVLGRETKEKKNQPLFYIYDDGTVEKRIVIE